MNCFALQCDHNVMWMFSDIENTLWIKFWPRIHINGHFSWNQMNREISKRARGKSNNLCIIVAVVVNYSSVMRLNRVLYIWNVSITIKTEQSFMLSIETKGSNTWIDLILWSETKTLANTFRKTKIQITIKIESKSMTNNTEQPLRDGVETQQ